MIGQRGAPGAGRSVAGSRPVRTEPAPWRRAAAQAVLVLGIGSAPVSPAQGHGGVGPSPGPSAPGVTGAEQTPWGIAGRPGAATRTIHVTMGDDLRFRPDRIQVREGETVRLRVRNAGKGQHELVMGSRRDLDEHAQLMLKFPGMSHDEAHMVHVAPGRTGEIVWTFNRPGEFVYGCLVGGHFQAGMAGRIQVIPR